MSGIGHESPERRAEPGQSAPRPQPAGTFGGASARPGPAGLAGLARLGGSSRPGADLVIGLQRSAGNRAVTAALGAGQRRHRPVGPVTTTVIQRKGPVKLSEMIGRKERSIERWAMQRELARSCDVPDAALKNIMDAIRRYDGSADGRPSNQLGQLRQITLDLGQYNPPDWKKWSEQDRANLHVLEVAVDREFSLVEQQHRRIQQYTADDEAPYEMMTAEGALWKQPEWEHSAPNRKKAGFEYLSELSQLNRQGMAEEIPPDQGWVETMKSALASELQSAVLNHYTTASRAQKMVGAGRMMSKVMLAREVSSFRHNTSDYDDHGLANAGFVFFFLEAKGTPFRETRFSKDTEAPEDEPARISINIGDSGLLERGWIMLSDFAQREYPTVVANPENPAESASFLSTRKLPRDKAHLTQEVRHFEQGVGMLQIEDFEGMQKREPDPGRRQALTSVMSQARGDKDSKMVYGSKKGGPLHAYADRLHQNILVGRDIIPGLVERAVVETARIAKVNPELGTRLQKMSGKELMKFLLKDLLRPQAMVPNTVAIKAEHIEPAPKKPSDVGGKDGGT
jgi:hypothetical protein